MKWWTFHPLDTWFFRKGMPFHQGESSAVQPESGFPPPMQTLQGAIRTTLARRQGWVPKKPLPHPLGCWDDLGDLRLLGPFLKWQETLLYPVPYSLVGKKDQTGAWQLTRLKPGSEVETDLGMVRLPVPEDDSIKGKHLEAWLTLQGINEILAGEIPPSEAIITPEDLWKAERRVGIMRDEKTRTAKDHHLYTSIHTRPEEGLSVVVGVDGVPSDWHPKRTTIPLGGEGRMAMVDVSDENDGLQAWLPKRPELYTKNGRLFYTATLITPAQYKNVNDVVCEKPPELPGKCWSASIGKPELIGGWDLKENKPRPLQALLPAGSTWWMEANEEAWDQVIQLHGRIVGQKMKYGMGQLVIGQWNGEVIQP